MNETIQNLIMDEVYTNLVEDYIDFASIYFIIIEKVPETSTLSDIVSGIVAELVKDNQVYIGKFIKKNAEYIYTPWQGTSSYRYNQFLSEWRAINFREPDISEVCYFTHESIYNKFKSYIIL